MAVRPARKGQPRLSPVCIASEIHCADGLGLVPAWRKAA